MGDTPIGFDALIETIGVNFVFLPILSIIIYGLSILVVRRKLNSLWYISLGLPASVFFLLGMADEILLPDSNSSTGGQIAQDLLLALAFYPGVTVSLGVLLFHLATFSRTKLTSRSSYLWGLAIVATYCLNWLEFLFLYNA